MMGDMVRRWVIRGLALVVLTLCAMAWVGSYWRWVQIEYQGKFWNRFLLQSGRIALFQEDERAPFSISSSWQITFDTNVERDRWARSDRDAAWHVMGFAYYPDPGDVPGRMTIRWWSAPLWLPTAFSAAMLWWAWRKTRVKGSRNAFPVEVADKGEGSAAKSG